MENARRKSQHSLNISNSLFFLYSFLQRQFEEYSLNIHILPGTIYWTFNILRFFFEQNCLLQSFCCLSIYFCQINTSNLCYSSDNNVTNTKTTHQKSFFFYLEEGTDQFTSIAGDVSFHYWSDMKFIPGDLQKFMLESPTVQHDR